MDTGAHSCSDRWCSVRAFDDSTARRSAAGRLARTPPRRVTRRLAASTIAPPAPALSSTGDDSRRGKRAARPNQINLRSSDSWAARAPYSRATSCLRTRPETDHATVVLGSRARRNRRAHPANARDETESRRRRNHETIPPYYRRSPVAARRANDMTELGDHDGK